jgi:hypothetical protein
MNEPLDRFERRDMQNDNDALRSEEVRALARRVQFWRNITGLLIGLLAMLAVVFWMRYSMQRSRCLAAFEHYAAVAEAAGINRSPRAQWPYIDRDNVGYPPGHYDLLIQNWGTPRTPDESIPLAVCESPHGALFLEGRHALYRVGDHLKVRWVPESVGRELCDQARQYERALSIHK